VARRVASSARGGAASFLRASHGRSGAPSPLVVDELFEVDRCPVAGRGLAAGARHTCRVTGGDSVMGTACRSKPCRVREVHHAGCSLRSRSQDGHIRSCLPLSVCLRHAESISRAADLHRGLGPADVERARHDVGSTQRAHPEPQGPSATGGTAPTPGAAGRAGRSRPHRRAGRVRRRARSCDRPSPPPDHPRSKSGPVTRYRFCSNRVLLRAQCLGPLRRFAGGRTVAVWSRWCRWTGWPSTATSRMCACST
jgi:hypothetical protein